MDTYFGTVYMEADVPHTFSCGLTLGIHFIANFYRAESPRDFLTLDTVNQFMTNSINWAKQKI